MKKWKIVLIIAGVLIILGIILGLFFPQGDMSCTQKGCICGDGEIPCNSCSIDDPIFILGVFNIIKYCEYSEVLICQEGKEIDTRYDKKGSCKLKIGFFLR